MYHWWMFPDIYGQDEIKDINKFLKKNFIDDGIDGPAEGVVKTSAVGVVQWGDISNTMAKIEHCMLYANRVNFAYDTHLPLDMLQLFNHNTYCEGEEYGWHQDKISDPNRINDIKLTFIINLSEQSYTGGDLYITKKEKMEFGPGSAIVFTGGLYHKVTPVVDGTRISLTTWIEGPRWR